MNRLSCALAVLAFASSAAAQTVLEPIIVDAAGLEPAEAARQGSAVSVITRAELEARQVRHAADALRTVPGVNVSAAGGKGQQTQLRIRGGEANHTKVLIDGVEVNSLDAGDFQFETLLTEDIERIEVVRGPQSGVFGSNALAGVVNIITRRGGPAHVAASAEAGSFNTHGLAASAGGGGEWGYANVTATRRETDGYNLARTGTENDGSEQQTIFARAGITPTQDFRVDVMGRVQRNDAEIDTFTSVFDSALNAVVDDGKLDDVTAYSNTRDQQLMRVSAEIDTFADAWVHKVFADRFKDDFDSFSPGFDFFNRSERDHYGYQSTLSFAGYGVSHTLVGLVEQKDEFFANEGFAFPPMQVKAERSQTGIAAEYRIAVADTYFLTGNVRHDDNDSFEDVDTYRVSAAALPFGPATRLHGSVGKGVTDPTFFEQFGFTLNFRGNPNLTPEQSDGWDAGLEHTFIKDRLTLDVTYFDAVLTDAIIGAGQSVVNIAGETDRRGIEVSLRAVPVPELVLTAGYTWLDTETPDGSRLTRRPEHSGSLDATYLFGGGRGTASLTAIYNGEMDDTRFANTFFFDPAPFGNFVDQTSRVTLDEYFVVNAAATWKLDDHVTLFARGENILNENYEEVFSYRAQPAAAYAGVKVSLGGDTPIAPAPLK